jgi:uncharacterized protein with GYD domain
MAKYLLQVSYTADGAKGLLKDGGSKRKQVAQALVEQVGGKIEAFYFAFGKADAIVVLDMPDSSVMSAASLALAASGAIKCITTVLITPEEMDQAAKISTSYTPPGR